MRPDWLVIWMIPLCLISASIGMAQPADRLVTGDFQRIDVDPLGYLYVITRNNQLKKYAPNGDSLGVFNDVVRYGRVHTMDVSNPMRMLLFYRDFGTIVLLDRMLRTLDVIDLRRHSMLQITAAATSYDNLCWVYDEQAASLRKIDAQCKVVLETPDLRMLLNDPPTPLLINDHQGTVILYDPEQGLYRFDLYGAFQQRVPLIGWKDVRTSGKYVDGWMEDQVFRYDVSTGQTVKYRIGEPLKKINQLVFQQQFIYVLDSDGVLRIDRRALHLY